MGFTARAKVAAPAVLLALFAASPLAAKSETDSLTSGTWKQVFSAETEVVLRRSVLVDVASYTAGGLGLHFRQAERLLVNDGNLPKGSVTFTQRSVNCSTGQNTIHGWTTVSPTGAVLAAQTIANPVVGTIQWDSAEGRVLGFVCRGTSAR